MSYLKKLFELVKAFSDIPTIVTGTTGALALFAPLFDKLSISISINIFVFMGILLLMFPLSAIVLPLALHKLRLFRFKLKAPRLWAELKEVIRQYVETQPNPKAQALEKKYAFLKSALAEVTICYGDRVVERLNKTENFENAAKISLQNFQVCFFPPDLKSWREIVKRNTSKELDCFDKIPTIIQQL